MTDAIDAETVAPSRVMPDAWTCSLNITDDGRLFATGLRAIPVAGSPTIGCVLGDGSKVWPAQVTFKYQSDVTCSHSRNESLCLTNQ